MPADIIVKYNGTTFSPTPLVNQNTQFVDYNQRWGSVTEIELNGNITGITAGNYLSIQSGFAGNFTGQFGALDVFEGANPIYQWRNVIVDEVALSPNRLLQTSITPYSVKMRAFSVLSGVTEPSNEYAFNQGDDGIVTVTHRVSAKGVRNDNYALNNAKAFVQGFLNISPFAQTVASTWGPAFVPFGSGILVGTVENIDRATATYSVQETYKYGTGQFIPYIESFSINLSDVTDNEWLTMDVDWRLQGSAVKNNIALVEAALVSPMNKIGAVGYSTGNLIQTNASYNRDTGAAVINVKASFLSGYNTADALGYFDYVVGFSFDGTQPREDWRIDGEFFCLGPRDYRAARILKFKQDNGTDWRGYLTGLIISSPIYTSQHNPNVTWGSLSEFTINENTGLAQLKLSLSSPDGAKVNGLVNAKYSLEIQPNKWNYDLLPSANIEGHYVLQDLQMMSQAKINVAISAETINTFIGLNAVSGYVDTLLNKYQTTGYLISRSYHTGITDVSSQAEWLGVDTINSGLLSTKVAGSSLTNFVRKPGYKFGY